MELGNFEGWRTCLKIQALNVWVYKMGCLVLINADEIKEKNIFDYLKPFLKSNALENMAHFRECDTCMLDEVDVRAEALSKSVRLKWIESEVDRLMEQAEPLLEQINKGTKRGFTPRYFKLVTKIQRFELESIGILALLGRSYRVVHKENYEDALLYYNVKDRLAILKKKLNTLTDIISMHELFGRFIGWQRLLVIEAILLICFPIPSFLSFDYVSIWQRILEWYYLILR